MQARWPTGSVPSLGIGIIRDQIKNYIGGASSAPERRSFYQQRGAQERRLPEAPFADGVIRSASLQHHSVAASQHLGVHHYGINRSHSSSGVDCPSVHQMARSLKKTVRFDADDDADDDWMTSSKDSSNAGWDWLLTGGRQESKESTARDSGVETLTSGEGELGSSLGHHQHPYDLHKSKVSTKSKREVHHHLSTQTHTKKGKEKPTQREKKYIYI